MQIASVNRGGLTAEYYENVWLFYAPVIRRVESTVDHSWGLGKLTDSASDYVSIRWSGAFHDQVPIIAQKTSYRTVLYKRAQICMR